MLRAGIGKRLPAIASTWLPEDEYDPAPVAARLSVKNMATSGFATGELHWRAAGDKGPPIRIARNADLSDLQMEKEELRRIATSDPVKQAIQRATEVISFDIQLSDTKQSMAWPVAMSAAAWLADAGKGVLYAKGDGWFEPSATDIKQLA